MQSKKKQDNMLKYFLLGIIHDNGWHVISEEAGNFFRVYRVTSDGLIEFNYVGPDGKLLWDTWFWKVSRLTKNIFKVKYKEGEEYHLIGLDGKLLWDKGYQEIYHLYGNVFIVSRVNSEGKTECNLLGLDGKPLWKTWYKNVNVLKRKRFRVTEETPDGQEKEYIIGLDGKPL